MELKRTSGVLLHPTSLPGSYGIGTIGQAAYKFVDWLKNAGQSLWQVLPLNPTGYGDSPYASVSTFAGNPLLIDLDLLLENKWTTKSITKPTENIKKNGNVNFGDVVAWKTVVLKNSAEYFLKNADSESLDLYKKFCKKSKIWLDDYSIFMSIKTEFDQKALKENTSGLWNVYWSKDLAKHEEQAIKDWNLTHKLSVEIYKVIQFFFDYQWQNLKNYANQNNIKIIGDIPIFVALDSADVWSNQKYFQMDQKLNLKAVAGVPPDYFSSTGQLWGNPLYDWNVLKKNNYDWWITRIKRVYELADILRIDHFRGFESYWAIPSGEETAINGVWKKGPGLDLFNAIKKKLGDIPIIAEDLGIITDEVRNLRDKSGFPGMKVLQFAFDVTEAKENGMTNAFLPHNYVTNNCVVYTGTHDNDTLQGWLLNCTDEKLLLIGQYVTGMNITLAMCKKMLTSGELCNKIILMALSSCANLAIIPMQDILCLDNTARMNMPSTMGNNWSWRMKPNALSEQKAKQLNFLSKLYGRNILNQK